MRVTATGSGTQKPRRLSDIHDVVFFNKMYLQAPEKIKKLSKRQDPEDTESESVQQDERGDIVTMEFDSSNDDFSVVDSVGPTPTINCIPGQSKYGCTYRRTMHYDPTTGRTIGAEATALANYYQCLKKTDDNIEFSNVGAGIGGGFENAMELKPMKYKEAVDGPDGEAWAEEINNEHYQMVKNDTWGSVKKTSLPRGTKVIDSTWPCKKKSTGKLRVCLNAPGFKQVEGVH